MEKSRFTPAYQEFLRLLIETRKTLGISQTELAMRLAREQAFISKYERGERRLDVIDMIKINRAMGVNPVHFLKRLLATEPLKPKKRGQ